MDSQNPFFLDILQDKEQGFESFDNIILMSFNLHSKLKWDNLHPPLQKTQLLRDVNGETALS